MQKVKVCVEFELMFGDMFSKKQALVEVEYLLEKFDKVVNDLAVSPNIMISENLHSPKVDIFDMSES